MISLSLAFSSPERLTNPPHNPQKLFKWAPHYKSLVQDFNSYFFTSWDTVRWNIHQSLITQYKLTRTFRGKSERPSPPYAQLQWPRVSTWAESRERGMWGSLKAKRVGTQSIRIGQGPDHNPTCGYSKDLALVQLVSKAHSYSGRNLWVDSKALAGKRQWYKHGMETEGAEDGWLGRLWGKVGRTYSWNKGQVRHCRPSWEKEVNLMQVNLQRLLSCQSSHPYPWSQG